MGFMDDFDFFDFDYLIVKWCGVFVSIFFVGFF